MKDEPTQSAHEDPRGKKKNTFTRRKYVLQKAVLLHKTERENSDTPFLAAGRLA